MTTEQFAPGTRTRLRASFYQLFGAFNSRRWGRWPAIVLASISWLGFYYFASRHMPIGTLIGARWGLKGVGALVFAAWAKLSGN